MFSGGGWQLSGDGQLHVQGHNNDVHRHLEWKCIPVLPLPWKFPLLGLHNWEVLEDSPLQRHSHRPERCQYDHHSTAPLLHWHQGLFILWRLSFINTYNFPLIKEFFRFWWVPCQGVWGWRPVRFIFLVEKILHCQALRPRHSLSRFFPYEGDIKV